MRIRAEEFRTMKRAFPHYVTDDDREMTEYELMREVARRQQDDLNAANTLLEEAFNYLLDPSPNNRAIVAAKLAAALHHTDERSDRNTNDT